MYTVKQFENAVKLLPVHVDLQSMNLRGGKVMRCVGRVNGRILEWGSNGKAFSRGGSSRQKDFDLSFNEEESV